MSKTESALYCDDVLVAIFVAARKVSGCTHFRAHDHKLQRVFHKLQGKFLWLRCFVFSSNGPEPFSRLLEEAIGNLQLAGLLNRPDLKDWEVIGIKPAAESYFREKLQQQFSVQEQQQLEEIAAAFLEHIAAVSD